MELETAQLRNKLTMGDKKLENGSSKFNLYLNNINIFVTCFEISSPEQLKMFS